MDLREFRLYSDYFAIGLSVLFNSLLMFLVFTEKNSTLKSYSRMIILSCLVDYIFCFGAVITVIDIVIKDGAFIAISDGFLRHLPIEYHYLFVGIHIFVVGCATCLVPVDYIYRYQLVCRKREPSTSQLIFITLICCLACLITTILFICAFKNQKVADIEKYGYILRDEGIWTYENGFLVKFIGTDCTNPRLLVAIGVCTLVTTSSYAISIFLGYKIYKELHSIRTVISKTTLRLQKSMTWVLIIKAVVPFCLATTPVLLLIITVGMHINIPNFGLWLVIVVSWIPVISPVSTFILLSGYRKRISQGLRTTNMVVNQGNTHQLTVWNSRIN